jgi:Histidine kinase
MLIGQARVEATRHEQKRAQAADKLTSSGKQKDAKEVADAWANLVTLTRRAVLMDAQVDLLEGKRKALARHRAAVAEIADATAPSASEAGDNAGRARALGAGDTMPPSMARHVLNAQEDLRREIARAMHDGPAQSLSNIVLQAGIVERLLERDPAAARGEVGVLVSMVQQTLDATKSFIFDVRPMVLDDLGLVPTLRRAARDRGRRASVAVDFDSLGQDRRLPREVESTVFRILDEALAAYLALGPDTAAIRLDWTDVLDARLTTRRAAPATVGEEPLPSVPTGDVPEALKQMIQDRHDARRAAEAAAEAAAIVVLPATTQRDIAERAGMIGASVEVLAGGGEVHLAVPIASAAGEDPAEA